MTHNLSIDDDTWGKLEKWRGASGERSVASLIRKIVKLAEVTDEIGQPP